MITFLVVAAAACTGGNDSNGSIPSSTAAFQKGITGYQILEGEPLRITLLGSEKRELGVIETAKIDEQITIEGEFLRATVRVRYFDAALHATTGGEFKLLGDLVDTKATQIDAASRPWFTALVDPALAPTLRGRGIAFEDEPAVAVGPRGPSGEVPFGDCHFETGQTSDCLGPGQLMSCWQGDWNGQSENQQVYFWCGPTPAPYYCQWVETVTRNCDTACINSACPGYGPRGCIVTGRWDNYYENCCEAQGFCT